MFRLFLHLFRLCRVRFRLCPGCLLRFLRSRFFLHLSLVQFSRRATPFQLLPSFRIHSPFIHYLIIPQQPASAGHRVPAHNTVLIFIGHSCPANLLHFVFFFGESHAREQFCSILLRQLSQLRKIYQLRFLYHNLPQLVFPRPILIKCDGKGKIIPPVSILFHLIHRPAPHQLLIVPGQHRNRDLIRKFRFSLHCFIGHLPPHSFRAHLKRADYRHLHQYQRRPERSLYSPCYFFCHPNPPETLSCCLFPYDTAVTSF